MVVGFNHNFQYKGVTYHIQTEDGGLGSPNIITLLYHGGTILASRKTSYADITKANQLEKVVEDLMKDQHKGMLRSLKNGEFDDVIARYQARSGHKATPAKPAAPAAPAAPVAPVAPVKPAAPVKPVTSVASEPKPIAAKPVQEPAAAKLSSREAGAPASKPAPAVASSGAALRQQKEAGSPPPKQTEKKPTVAASLDEIVLSYLMGDEK